MGLSRSLDQDWGCEKQFSNMIGIQEKIFSCTVQYNYVVYCMLDTYTVILSLKILPECPGRLKQKGQINFFPSNLINF
jgi:hypothetical protein